MNSVITVSNYDPEIFSKLQNLTKDAISSLPDPIYQGIRPEAALRAEKNERVTIGDDPVQSPKIRYESTRKFLELLSSALEPLKNGSNHVAFEILDRARFSDFTVKFQEFLSTLDKNIRLLKPTNGRPSNEDYTDQLRSDFHLRGINSLLKPLNKVVEAINSIFNGYDKTKSISLEKYPNLSKLLPAEYSLSAAA